MNVFRTLFKKPLRHVPYDPAVHVPYVARSPIPFKIDQNIPTCLFDDNHINLPDKVEESLELLDVHYFVPPIDATFNHPEYSRFIPNDKPEDLSITLAFAQSIQLCKDIVCKGCHRCWKTRCFLCKEKLGDFSCSRKELLPGSHHELVTSPEQVFAYRLNFLVTDHRGLGLKADYTYDVCADCVLYSIASSEPICHDPTTQVCLYKFYCSEIENLLRVGKSKQFDGKDFFLRENGRFTQLNSIDMVKMLEICPGQEDDLIVTYGSLEVDLNEDKHIFSQELDLSPSEIEALVVANSE